MPVLAAISGTATNTAVFPKEFFFIFLLFFKCQHFRGGLELPLKVAVVEAGTGMLLILAIFPKEDLLFFNINILVAV